jgi:hypothetical protein
MMSARRTSGAVTLALRSYPERWRSRHGVEAADIAAMLIEDGVRPSSVAWSYFKGAARERVAPAHRRRFAARVAALSGVISLAGVSIALCLSPPTAGATSVVRAEGTGPAPVAAGLLSCNHIVGYSVAAAVPVLRRLGLQVTWELDGTKDSLGAAPPGWYRVVGARALSPGGVTIKVAPPGRSVYVLEGSRGRAC